MNLNDQICMKNKFLLISPLDKQKKLSNGLNISESRGKRDVIVGVIEAAEPGLKLPEKAICWFPLYAGSEVTIGDRSFLAVPHEDIIMIEKVME